MRTLLSLDAGAAQRHLTGWTASLLAHGAAAGIAVLLATEFQPSPPEPFQWRVSLAEPAPGPAAAQTPPASPAQPVAHPEPAPAPAAGPVRPTDAQAVTQPAAPPQPVAHPEPAPTPAELKLEPAQPRPGPAEEPQPVIARAAPAAPSSPAVQETVTTVSQTAPAAAAPLTKPAPLPSSSESLDTRLRAPEPAAVSAPSIASASSSKRDYGWLTEALWGRIEQMKHYPATARLNRWEGKVVLRAVIREDGHVADLRIAQSSGHDVLDQDALALMQQISPIPLKQPLGRSQVVVHIPISYKLEQ